MASHHFRASVEAVVQSHHGTTPQDVATDIEAFGYWIAYWNRAIEALGITAVSSYASPHCVDSVALIVAASERALPFVMPRHTSLEDICFASSVLRSVLDRAIEFPAAMRFEALEDSERSAAFLVGPYERARPFAMRPQVASMASPEAALVSRGLRFIARRARGIVSVAAPEPVAAIEGTPDPSPDRAPRQVWPSVLTQNLRSGRDARVGKLRRPQRRPRAQRVLQTAYSLHVTKLTARRNRPLYVYFPMHYQPDRTTAT